MSQYSKNLMGVNAAVFVAPAVAYTALNYQAFALTAPEGAIGVFNEDGTIRSTAVAAGVKFFVAQKRDGAVKKTPVLAFEDIYLKQMTDYSAPVKKVMAVGYNGSSGDMGFDFTGATAVAPKEFTVSVRETTPGNQPFPVQEGRAVVTSASADEYTVLAQIASQLNSDFDYERLAGDPFIVAEILTNGAMTEFAEDPTVVNGSTVVTFAGAVTVATGAHVKFEGVAGPTYRVATGVTAGTQIILDRPYQGASKTEDVSVTVDIAGTAAFTSGTTLIGLRLRAKEFGSHFVVSVQDSLAGISPVTTTTSWALGSGDGPSVVELENEGDIFDGVGSTVNAAFKDDFGQPTKFASATGAYDLFFVNLAPKVIPSAALPDYVTQQIQRIIIAAPESGTSPTSQLKTVFAV